MLTGYVHNVRRIRREAWIVLAGAGVRGLAWNGLSDTLVSLYLVRMGHGPAFVGLAAAVGNFGYALAAMPGAAVARRVGARLGLIAGSGTWALGLVLLSLADLVPAAWQAPWILMMRLLASVGLALDAVSGQPYLAASTTPDERPHAFAMMQALTPLGAFLGSLLAGLLPGVLVRTVLPGAGLDGPRAYGATLALGTLTYLPLLGLLLTLPRREAAVAAGAAVVPADAPAAPPSVRATRSRKVRGSDLPAARAGYGGRAPYGVLGAVALVCLLRVSGEFTARTFFSVYLDVTWVVSAAQIGGAVAVANLLTVPAPLVTPLLVRGWGRAATIALGALGVAASIMALGLAPGWAFAGGAFVAMNVMAAMARSVWSVMVQESVDPGWRPMAAGVSNLASGMGIAVMSSVGGVMAAALGFRATFTTAAVLVALGAAAVWVAFRERRAAARTTVVSRERAG